MFFVALAAFVAFPESEDAILNSKKNYVIETEASGSLGFIINGKCVKTNETQTFNFDEKSDWCSNINPNGKNPYIQYSVKNKKMKLKKYSVRNGCCRGGVQNCCTETGEKLDVYCCCRLFSYSLRGSNDGRTWTTLHSVEKDNDFYFCLTKTFDINSNGNSYKYVKFVLDEPFPNRPNCMQINQIELYGEVFDAESSEYEDIDDDESISIIGRVNKHA